MTEGTTLDFTRFFGDNDGDQDTDSSDINDFRTTYGKSAGDADYNAAFDENADGYIGSDELMTFRENYGRSLPPSYAAAMQEYAAVFPGDLNGDGRVGSADLDIVRAHWGGAIEAGILYEGDASGDGIVGSADLDLVRANWGRVLSASASTVATPSEASFAAGSKPVYGPARKEDTGSAAKDAALANWDAAEAAWAGAIEALHSREAHREKMAQRRAAVDLVLEGLAE